jgi:hypothetical protein
VSLVYLITYTYNYLNTEQNEQVTNKWMNNSINPLTPELNPSAQRCLTRFYTGDFAYWTMSFVNIYVKNQQMQQLFIQFINYVW